MTDKEIIKALECCISNRDCSECVFMGTEIKENTTCEVKMIKYALALINRQQAEIERLEKRNVTNCRNWQKTPLFSCQQSPKALYSHRVIERSINKKKTREKNLLSFIFIFSGRITQSPTLIHSSEA